MKRTILLADDEPKIVDVLSLYLGQAGYDVVPAYTGCEALQLAEEIRPSLVVLDLMLPDLTGEEVCSTLRSKSSVPILMLTAKHKDEDRLRGLSIGADDYVTKPFNSNEVVARVGAILRRTHEDRPLADKIVYRAGDLVVDAVQQVAFKNGVNADLTATEYKLLTTFGRHPKRVFS